MRRQEFGDPAEEFEVGQAEGEADGEAEAEDGTGEGLEGDGIGAAGGQGDAFEGDEGGGVVAASEVEPEEEMGLVEWRDGFVGEEHGCRVLIRDCCE